ncbi:MAG: hypothetical protein M0D57_08840 [Sphingobacteriales bacterium JAD_PAG50586_3]|nr:MAG: hypothetical protein M0D57_08840 [Sphingobacteriales bacterium JAD_PAG50586_3]
MYTLSGTNKTISGTTSPTTFTNLTISIGAASYTNNIPLLTVGTAFAGTGTLIMGANTQLNIGGTLTVTNLNCTTNTPNTIAYNGTGAQTIKIATYDNLTINKAGQTGTLAVGNAVVKNTLTIDAGTFSLGSVGNTITLEGNYLNNGTFTCNSSSTLILAGNTNTTFTPGTLTGSSIFALTIAKAVGAAVTLNAPVTTATLNMTSGLLNTTSTNILTVSGTTAASVVGGSSTSYVNGPLQRTFPASLATGSTYSFPIGTTAGYGMFQLINPITNTGGAFIVRAEVTDGTTGGGNSTYFSLITTGTRYWQAQKISGTSVFTSIGNVQIDDDTYTATGTNAIGTSSTLTGTYNSIGGLLTSEIISTATVPTALGFFTIGSKPCLNGNYTIGSGGDYTSITAAVAALNQSAVCSNLVFELLSTYNGTSGETFPIAINQLSYGSGGPFTVIFRPQTGVTARVTSGTPGANNPLINFNGADRVIFDGRAGGIGTSEWTITNTLAASSGAVILFNNDSQRDTLRFLTLSGTSTGASVGIIHISTANASGFGNDSLGIANNNIIGSLNTTASAVNAIYSEGTNTRFNDHVTIANNNISLFRTYGINANQYTGVGWNINNNNLFNATATSVAIYLNSNTANDYIINSNKIGGAARDGSGNVTGVWNNGATSFTGIDVQVYTTGGTATISNNIIQEFSGSGLFTGIEVGVGNVSITGNLIGNTNSANSINLTGTVFTGIQFGAGTTVDINGNTIAGVTQTNGSVTSCNGILGNVASNITIRNNTISTLTAIASATTIPNMFGISVGGTAASLVTVNQNTIKSLYLATGSGAAKITGINHTGPSTAQDVSNNNIHSFRLVTSSTSGNMTGIALNAGNSHCFNNMIRLGIDSTGTSVVTNHIIRGIDVITTGTYKITHNSVYIGGTAAASNTIGTAAFYKTTTGTTNLANNIFVNNRNNGTSGTARNTAIFCVNATNLTGSNYNLYQATGTGGALATYDGGTNYRTTIADIYNNTAFDDNSLSGDPQFIAPTTAAANLHISTTNPTPIEGVGTTISPAVNTDIDGDDRTDVANTPIDLGADAGNFVPVDQTPPLVAANAVTPPCNIVSTFAITANASDASGIDITAGTAPVYTTKNQQIFPIPLTTTQQLLRVGNGLKALQAVHLSLSMLT